MTTIKKILSNLWNGFVDFTVRVCKIGFSSTDYQKFLVWAEINNYKIKKIEASSTWEGGFVIVSRDAKCAKVILIDTKNNLQGAYLLTGLASPVNAMQVKFTSPDKIRFKEPFEVDENGDLTSSEICFPAQNA